MLPVHSLQWTVDMNREPGTAGSARRMRNAGSVKSGLLLTMALLVLGVVLAFWLVSKRNPPVVQDEPVVATPTPAEPEIAVPSSVTQDEPPAETKRTTLKPRVSSIPAPA